MPGAKDIRAGGAFVEAYMDKSRLLRDMNSLGLMFKKFGAAVSAAGKKLMVVGTAVVGPFLLAAKSFAKMGDDLDKMSGRVGASVEFLSALGFAAQIGGSNIETMEKNIRRLQRTAYDAQRGLSTAVDGFNDLGISATNADGTLKDTEQLFMETIDALSKVESETKKAALAQVIFGRGGTAMLPMLKQGKEGLQALMEEAKKRGFVITKEEADAAAAFTDAITRLGTSAKRAWFQIGAAIAGTGFVDQLTMFVDLTRKWIGENKRLLSTIFMLGTITVAVGAGLLILGKILMLVGSALTLGTVATKAFSVALLFLKGIALVATNPFGLLGLAVAAVGGYFLYTSGAAGKAWNYIHGALSGILTEAKTTFGTIAESLAQGDITSAAKVGWAFIKLQWTRGVNYVEGLWDKFKGFWNDSTFELAVLFTNATAKIKTIWAELLGWLSKKWLEFATSPAVEEGFVTFNKMFKPLMEKLGIDVNEGAIRHLMGQQREALPGKLKDIDADTETKRKAIERDRAGAEDALIDDKLKRDKDRAKREKDAADAVDAAKREWELAVKEAGAKAKELRDKGAAGMPGMEGLGGLAFGSAGVSGTFRASAVSSMGQAGVLNRMEGHMRKFVITGNTMVDEMKKFNMETQP